MRLGLAGFDFGAVDFLMRETFCFSVVQARLNAFLIGVYLARETRARTAREGAKALPLLTLRKTWGDAILGSTMFTYRQRPSSSARLGRDVDAFGIAFFVCHVLFLRRRLLLVGIEIPDHFAGLGKLPIRKVLPGFEVMQGLSARAGEAVPPTGLGHDLIA